MANLRAVFQTEYLNKWNIYEMTMGGFLLIVLNIVFKLPLERKETVVMMNMSCVRYSMIWAIL